MLVILLFLAGCSHVPLLGSFKEQADYSNSTYELVELPSGGASDYAHVIYLPYHDAGIHCREQTGKWYAEACSGWRDGHCAVVMPRREDIDAHHFLYLRKHELQFHCFEGRGHDGGKYVTSDDIRFAGSSETRGKNLPKTARW